MRCGASKVTPSWDPSLPTPQGLPAAIGVLRVKLISQPLTEVTGSWPATGGETNAHCLEGKESAEEGDLDCAPQQLGHERSEYGVC